MPPPPYGNQAGLQVQGGGKWGPIGSPPQRVPVVPQLDSVQTSVAPYYQPPINGESSLNAEAALAAVGIGGVDTSGAMNPANSNQGYSGWLRLLDSHAAAAGAGVSQEWANHAGQVLMHSLSREGKGDRFGATPSFGPPMSGRPMHGEGAQGNLPHDELVDRYAPAVQMSPSIRFVPECTVPVDVGSYYDFELRREVTGILSAYSSLEVLMLF